MTVTWGTIIWALLQALPEVLKLATAFKASVDAKVNRGIGFEAAVAEGLQQMQKDLEASDAAVQAARDRQAKSPGSDEGLDTDFRRD